MLMKTVTKHRLYFRHDTPVYNKVQVVMIDGGSCWIDRTNMDSVDKDKTVYIGGKHPYAYTLTEVDGDVYEDLLLCYKRGIIADLELMRNMCMKTCDIINKELEGGRNYEVQ